MSVVPRAGGGTEVRMRFTLVNAESRQSSPSASTGGIATEARSGNAGRPVDQRATEARGGNAGRPADQRGCRVDRRARRPA